MHVFYIAHYHGLVGIYFFDEWVNICWFGGGCFFFSLGESKPLGESKACYSSERLKLVANLKMLCPSNEVWFFSPPLAVIWHLKQVILDFFSPG